MRSIRRGACAALCILILSPRGLPQSSASGTTAAVRPAESLTFGVEWRLIRAGTVKLVWAPGQGSRQNQADVTLLASGIVAKLYTVNDHYTVHSDAQLCATDILFRAEEGKRKRETLVTFDHGRKKASYLEKDLIKNTTARREVDIAPCTYDVINALYHLRGVKLDPGQSVQLPVSDGKKMVYVKVEAQEREQVKTPTGTYNTIRYEAMLFNDVLYSKKGRMFVNVTDDARRLPVQIKARLQFPIGTITFQLEKLE